MTTKPTEAHDATPAAEPLALRLSEGLGPTPPLPRKKPAVFHHPTLDMPLYDGLAMDLHAMAYAEPLFAEIALLRAELAKFTPLRAKGVVDADDNLDCWDTNPYEICTRHVAALNKKDPSAMWRVVDLFARDEG